MDTGPSLSTENQGIEATIAGPRPIRRFRLRLGTLLVLVAALAPAFGLYAEMVGIETTDPDHVVVTLLAVILTGIAVGAWRRASASQVIAQIGLVYAALLLLIEVEGTRLTNYWLLMITAVLIVLPLLLRCLESVAPEAGYGGRRLTMAAVLLNAFFNLTAVALFFITNILLENDILELTAGQIYSSRSVQSINPNVISSTTSPGATPDANQAGSTVDADAEDASKSTNPAPSPNPDASRSAPNEK